MNLKCACAITRKRCYRYRLSIVFWIISFVCLCYCLTLYQTIAKQKNAPFELKAVYDGKDTVTDQLLSKVSKIKGVNGVTIVQQKPARIAIDDYKIDTNLIGVDAAYLNVALSQGTVFRDEDSGIKLIVNKAALKALMDSEDEDAMGEDDEGVPKHQDLSKENWLKKRVRVKLAGESRSVSGIICGILKEDKKTPLVYMTNSRLDQLSKTEKKNTKKQSNPTIYIRTQNIGISKKVSTSVDEKGFRTSNLNQNLVSSWEMLTQKETMYLSIALISYLAGLMLIRITKRLKEENEEKVTIHMRELGMSLVDLYHIKLLEVVFVTVIAIILGILALLVIQNVFYVVNPLSMVIIALVHLFLNLIFAVK